MNPKYFLHNSLNDREKVKSQEDTKSNTNDSTINEMETNKSDTTESKIDVQNGTKNSEKDQSQTIMKHTSKDKSKPSSASDVNDSGKEESQSTLKEKELAIDDLQILEKIKPIDSAKDNLQNGLKSNTNISAKDEPPNVLKNSPEGTITKNDEYTFSSGPALRLDDSLEPISESDDKQSFTHVNLRKFNRADNGEKNMEPGNTKGSGKSEITSFASHRSKGFMKSRKIGTNKMKNTRSSVNPLLLRSGVFHSRGKNGRTDFVVVDEPLAEKSYIINTKKVSRKSEIIGPGMYLGRVANKSDVLDSDEDRNDDKVAEDNSSLTKTAVEAEKDLYMIENLGKELLHNRNEMNGEHKTFRDNSRKKSIRKLEETMKDKEEVWLKKFTVSPGNFRKPIKTSELIQNGFDGSSITRKKNTINNSRKGVRTSHNNLDTVVKSKRITENPHKKGTIDSSAVVREIQDLGDLLHNRMNNVQNPSRVVYSTDSGYMIKEIPKSDTPQVDKVDDNTPTAYKCFQINSDKIIKLMNEHAMRLLGEDSLHTFAKTPLFNWNGLHVGEVRSTEILTKLAV